MRAFKGKELSLAVEALQESDDRILSLNRKQLFEGKKSDGLDLTPSYFDDPYFKTRESAARYSAWKDKITPNSKRKSGTPNLYINGFFHNRIEVIIDERGLRFTNDWEKTKDIKEKFGPNIFGLNSDSKVELNKTAAPLMISKFRKEIRL